MDLEQLLNSIDGQKLYIPFGRITSITSTAIIANGLDIAISDIVKIESQSNTYNVLGMVVSIGNHNFTIVPFSTLLHQQT